MELAEILRRITGIQEQATVKAVFGDPVTINGRTIISVARVAYGWGLGFGQGQAEKEGGKEKESERYGGGGGGGARIRPVAIVEVADGKTAVHPVVDATRLGLAGIALVAWSVFWITLTLRKRGRGKKEEK